MGFCWRGPTWQLPFCHNNFTKPCTCTDRQLSKLWLFFVTHWPENQTFPSDSLGHENKDITQKEQGNLKRNVAVTPVECFFSNFQTHVMHSQKKKQNKTKNKQKNNKTHTQNQREKKETKRKQQVCMSAGRVAGFPPKWMQSAKEEGGRCMTGVESLTQRQWGGEISPGTTREINNNERFGPKGQGTSLPSHQPSKDQSATPPPLMHQPRPPP